MFNKDTAVQLLFLAWSIALFVPLIIGIRMRSSSLLVVVLIVVVASKVASDRYDSWRRR